MNSQKTITELHKAFNMLNQAFYDNALPTPYIVIYETAKKSAYGWFTPSKVWQDADGNDVMHEIALSAEYMNRDYVDVIGTLHHEMIHLYCHTNGIKDTTASGRYHNKNFKNESEARGFYYPEDFTPDKVIGWSQSRLTDETKELIKSFQLDEAAFALARVIPQKKAASKSNSQSKYICPDCFESFRAKKNLNVMCGDCNVAYEEEC